MKALFLSTALVVYNIAVSLLPTKAHSFAYVPLNVLAAAILLLWARRVATLSPAQLGFTPGYSSITSATWGIGIGLAIGLPILLVLLLFRSHLPLHSLEAFTSTGIPDLLWRIIIWVPFGTVMLEETAFRGVLFAVVEQDSGLQRALILSSVAFALWHIGVVIRGLATGNLGPQSAILAFLAISIVTFIAGLGLAFVRVRTSSLVGPMVIHWVVNSLVTLALWQP